MGSVIQDIGKRHRLIVRRLEADNTVISSILLSYDYATCYLARAFSASRSNTDPDDIRITMRSSPILVPNVIYDIG